MATNAYPPFAHKMGRVIRPPDTVERGGKEYVTFPISVNRSFEKDDSDWVTVSVNVRKSNGDRNKYADQALALEKGDRVVVEGNYKESEGNKGGKVFRDIYAMSLWRATEIEADGDDDEL